MKKTYTNSTNTNKNEKLEATLKKLEEGVKVFQSSEEYRNYLKTMAKFHNYSFNNSLLIFLQKPDATYCAGFTTWKALGRYVKAGEKGLVILAPAFKKTEVELLNKDGTPQLDADGKPVTEVHTIPRYKVTTTFDYSQTDGKPLPKIGEELTGSVKDYQRLFDAIKQVAEDKGVSVGFEDIKGGSKGYYHLKEDRIAIKSGMSEVQNIKTLCHELCHSRLDRLDLKDDAGLKADRHGREIRAESCAFVIADHFGIDTSDYSFAYVTSWATGRDFKELREQMDNIRKVASEIITETEAILGKEMEQTKDATISVALVPVSDIPTALVPVSSVVDIPKQRPATKTKQPVLAR